MSLRTYLVEIETTSGDFKEVTVQCREGIVSIYKNLKNVIPNLRRISGRPQRINLTEAIDLSKFE